MPSFGVSKTRWPVVAWIRLRLPERPPPTLLMPGPPPPPEPPLEILESNPVPTDPRRRVFAYEEDHGDWVVRLVWDTDDPSFLEVECRAPLYGRRLAKEGVGAFWQAAKRLVAPISPVEVEAADPAP